MEGFFHWYYRVAFRTIRNIGLSLVIVTFDLFSIALLLKTLFAPWKRDVVVPVRQELPLLFQALMLNLASRGFGLVVRSVTVAVGSAVTAAVAAAASLAVALVWAGPVTLPMLLVAGFVLIGNGLSGWGGLLTAFAVVGPISAVGWYRHDRQTNPLLPEPLDQAIKLPEFVFRPYFTPEARRLLERAKDLDELTELLTKNEQARFVYQHLDLSTEEMIAAKPGIEPKSFIKRAAQHALKHHHERVEVADLVFTLIEQSKNLRAKLPEKKLTLSDVEQVCRWQVELWHELAAPSVLLNPSQLRSSGGIGRDWSSGWTPTLDAFSVDWSEQLQGRKPLHHYLAHRSSIESLERILARITHHNAALVGESGTGKRTVVMGLAEKIARSGSFSTLIYKRVIELDINRLLARADAVGDLEESLVKLMNEALGAGNVILMIDELDRLLFAEGLTVGRIDAASLLQPYLESPALKLVATTTPAGWHRILTYQPSIAASFEKIEVTEPNDAEMLGILEEVATAFEARYRILIPYASLKEVLSLAHQFLPEKKLPEKAIDLLDEAAVAVAEQSATKILRPADLDRIIQQKTHVLVGPVERDERQLLLNLEQVLHQNLINQDFAVRQIADAMRRARTGVKTRSRPIGAFLFLGPTGVGKTQTARSLALAYFGSEQNMIRFDMSEYDTLFSAERLIGGPTHPGGGLLTRSVTEKPFSLILLDEIDKADPKVLNLLLQLLDEGRLSDETGKTIDFTNTIIIATSNAGSEEIRERISSGEQVEQFAKPLIEQVQQQGIFRPEFLNRFDGVVVYRPLTEAELIEVLDIMVLRLNKQMAKEQIKITLEPLAKSKLVKLGFDPVYGARALERALADKVENLVAQKILKQELKPGMSFTVTGAMV